jgi:catechol 2,3-dioxygenase
MSNYHTNVSGHFNRVSLNVSDLSKVTEFYVSMIGLRLISKSEFHATLGIADRILLTLYRTETTQRNTGLYHFALLLPSRRDLGVVLLHLIKHNVLLQGASDHVISEAIYLSDPEGNGIEIAVDRNPSFWPFDQGKLNIIGRNGPLDVNNLMLEVGKNISFESLPDQTIIGHVHIHVHSIEKARLFYENILHMIPTIDLQKQALFLANANYHHHLAMNLWKQHDISEQSSSHLGLYTLHYKLPKSQTLKTFINTLDSYNYSYELFEDGVSLRDPANNHLSITK